MKKKNDLLFIIIFVIVVGISLLYLSQASYAKYRKQITGNVDATVAQWNIKVNNESINNKKVLSNYITPVLDSNEYVKEGVIAPGGTGHFDITINAKDVDVDFTYELEGEVNEETPLYDLVVTEYEQNGIKLPYNSENKITGTIEKNTGNTKVRVYFKWVDDDTNKMDNEDDTNYATKTENPDAKIKVTMRFLQKK